MQMRFLLLFFGFALFLSGCMHAPVSSDSRTQMPTKKVLAFVNAPVIDVLGSGPTKASHLHTESRYQHLPCGYLTAHHKSAPRVHQLLLNQLVYIKAEKPFETLIEVPGIEIGSGGKMINISGWVQKKHLTKVDVLQKKRHAEALFPDPLGLLKRGRIKHIALVSPYYIPQAKITLSAGTLFPLVHEQKNAYLTHIWDEGHRKFQMLEISKQAALAHVEMSREQAVKQYVALLRFWANQKSGFIPYVLGGGSWVGNYKNKKFEKTGTGNMREYHRACEAGALQSGFDCTTLIYNAARINNIPYFCRNTTAIKQRLRQVKKNERIKAGDLLLYPGHVAVISSIKPLKFIQARGYGPGYGRIVEGLAKDHFKNIKSVEDLKKKKPLEILTVNKKLFGLRKEWAIYRFDSCWDAFKH